MRKKQQSSVRREKAVCCATKPKKEKAKGQCMSDVYDSMTQREEMEECGRGRKTKNSFTLCTPSMDNRYQPALQTRSHLSDNTPHVCKNKFGRSRSSSRSFCHGSPIKSGCIAPVQSKSDSNGLSEPFNASYNWNMTRPAISYHGDARHISAYDSELQRRQPYMNSGDHEGEMSNAFSSYGSRPWTYASAKRPTISSCARSKYASPSYNRSLAAIMAEYAQPQTKIDNVMESIFNTSSKGVTSQSQNYISKNLTHNSSSYLTKPTSLQFSDSKSSPAFRFSNPRPRSAGGYHTGSTKLADNRDDMSTITFNAVRKDSAGSIGSTNLGFKPLPERKPLASKFGMSDTTFVSDDIERILQSSKATYYDTTSTSQQGLTSFCRKYDSSLNNDARHGYASNHSNISIPNAYDFRSRRFDTRDRFVNTAMSSLDYDDSESQLPSSKYLSGFMNNHWQSEKDRLNKITNIIGKSMYGSSKKE